MTESKHDNAAKIIAELMQEVGKPKLEPEEMPFIVMPTRAPLYDRPQVFLDEGHIPFFPRNADSVARLEEIRQRVVAALGIPAEVWHTPVRDNFSSLAAKLTAGGRPYADASGFPRQVPLHQYQRQAINSALLWPSILNVGNGLTHMNMGYGGHNDIGNGDPYHDDGIRMHSLPTGYGKWLRYLPEYPWDVTTSYLSAVSPKELAKVRATQYEPYTPDMMFRLGYLNGKTNMATARIRDIAKGRRFNVGTVGHIDFDPYCLRHAPHTMNVVTYTLRRLIMDVSK